MKRLTALAPYVFALTACAQPVEKVSNSHLTDVGMFYVGGNVEPDATQYTGQALVHYFESSAAAKTPVVMYPGLGLSSYIYISTPDGRQGWAQQFAKNGYSAYVYDPVNTGPSGLPVAAFQSDPPASVSNWNINQIWSTWGFGNSRDEPYDDTRFPVEDIDQFYASWPPRLAAGGNPGMGMGQAGGGAMGGGRALGGSPADIAAVIELLERIGPAVLMPHSMGGVAVFEVARQRPDLVRGIVVIEPVGCPREADQVSAWGSSVPFLAVYGDYIDSRRQTSRRDACRQTAELVSSAGSTGEMLELTDEGVFGNTHLLMQDDNSAEIGARIIEWIDANVD